MRLSTRQEKILEAIIKLYTKTAEPVSSAALLTSFKFPWSTATIRAEMAVLEADGFIYQQHTSAGRVPTDMGFRYYVNMMENSFADRSAVLEEQKLERNLSKHDSFEDIMLQVVKSLADLTRTLAIGESGKARYASGLTNILSEPEYNQQREVTEVAKLVDNLDYLFQTLPQNSFNIFIGGDIPGSFSANCAVIISKFSISDSKDAGIAIVGPMRLPYEKVVPLVRYTTKLLEDING